MDLLTKYNIDPYDILDVDPLSDLQTLKKAYRRKALELHPDKTNGRTEAEFKILVLSYKYAKQNCVVTPVKTQNELRDVDREPIDDIVQTDKNIYNTNFEDNDERRCLFSDDQIDFNTFEKQMKKIQNLPTSYTAESFYKKGVLDKMKSKGKFDIDKFNAFFLKLKKEGKTSTDLIKVERVKAMNEYDLYMKVNIYDGMVINTDDTEDTTNYNENYIITQKDVDDLINTDVKIIDKLINEHKKDTGKIPKKKVKEMMRKKSQDIAIERKMSFSQLEKDLEIKNMMKIQMENREQQNTVNKFKHIYTKSLPQFVE